MPAPTPRSAPSRGMRLVAALTVVALLGVLVYVLRQSGEPPGDERRGQFDPLTTDSAELRRVAEAVSRILAAPDAGHEVSIQGLEAVRAESPGARDLKEACVNTYRGMSNAEAM